MSGSAVMCVQREQERGLSTKPEGATDSSCSYSKGV